MVLRPYSQHTLTTKRQGSGHTMNTELRHPMRTPWTSWTKHAMSLSSARPSTNKRCDAQPTSARLSLQHRVPGPPPRAEQQGPPQALPALGGAIRHCGSTLARRLQAKNHRWRGLHQCLEHRAAMSLLPLNKCILSLIYFIIENPYPL